MFVLNPKRKGQLLCLWVPVREWSDMLTLLQGFAKNPTLLLLLWVLSNKQNGIFGKGFAKNLILFICDLPCRSCQPTNRKLIWITDNVVWMYKSYVQEIWVIILIFSAFNCDLKLENIYLPCNISQPYKISQKPVVSSLKILLHTQWSKEQAN